MQQQQIIESLRLEKATKITEPTHQPLSTRPITHSTESHKNPVYLWGEPTARSSSPEEFLGSVTLPFPTSSLSFILGSVHWALGLFQGLHPWMCYCWGWGWASQDSAIKTLLISLQMQWCIFICCKMLGIIDESCWREVKRKEQSEKFFINILVRAE